MDNLPMKIIKIDCQKDPLVVQVSTNKVSRVWLNSDDQFYFRANSQPLLVYLDALAGLWGSDLGGGAVGGGISSPSPPSVAPGGGADTDMSGGMVSVIPGLVSSGVSSTGLRAGRASSELAYSMSSRVACLRRACTEIDIVLGSMEEIHNCEISCATL